MEDEKDRLIELRLYSPHKCDFIYERENKTRYAVRQVSGNERFIVEFENDE